MFEPRDVIILLANLLIIVLGAWVAYTVKRLDKSNEKLWARLNEIHDKMVTPATCKAKHGAVISEVKALIAPLNGDVKKKVDSISHRVTVLETKAG